jgi:hypothetical protein
VADIDTDELDALNILITAAQTAANLLVAEADEYAQNVGKNLNWAIRNLLEKPK